MAEPSNGVGTVVIHGVEIKIPIEDQWVSQRLAASETLMDGVLDDKDGHTPSKLGGLLAQAYIDYQHIIGPRPGESYYPKRLSGALFERSAKFVAKARTIRTDLETLVDGLVRSQNMILTVSSVELEAPNATVYADKKRFIKDTKLAKRLSTYLEESAEIGALYFGRKTAGSFVDTSGDLPVPVGVMLEEILRVIREVFAAVVPKGFRGGYVNEVELECDAPLLSLDTCIGPAIFASTVILPYNSERNLTDH